MMSFRSEEFETSSRIGGVIGPRPSMTSPPMDAKELVHKLQVKHKCFGGKKLLIFLSFSEIGNFQFQESIADGTAAGDLVVQDGRGHHCYKRRNLGGKTVLRTFYSLKLID